MPAIRIRQPFLAAFIVLVLISAYLGLAQRIIETPYHSDKGLHFVTFFLLTATFYWILETSRRRCIHLTLLVCTAGLGIGSEFIQVLIPNNDRIFDPYDILANVVGSTLALLLCSWYHKRMLERRRKNKHYDIVAGDEGEVGGEDGDDVELGIVREQETGVLPADANGQAEAGAGVGKATNVTEELDNWDENAEDWDDEPVVPSKGDEPSKSPAPMVGEDEGKKRTD